MRPGQALAVLFVLRLAAAGASAQVYPNEISATGANATWIAVGDVDGDGRPDVAARGANDAVRILYGDGAGSFASFAEFPVGALNGARLADADGDGDEDLVAALCFPQELRLLRGDGSGALGPPETLASGFCLNEVVCADVNEDAVPDLLATTLSCTSCVLELLGDGAGGFLAPQIITATVGGKSSPLALADYDEDGHVDVVLGPADSVDKVQLLLGDGTGAFAAGPQLTLGGDRPFALAAGDLNGDRHADIAAACGHTSSNPGVVALLFGDGAGGFAPAVTLAQFKQPVGFAARDAEGDGDLDLFVLDSWRSQVAALPNGGAGVFGAPYDIVTPLGPGGLGVADFDGDGLADVATVGTSLGGVTVATGQPGGGYLAARRFPISQLGDSAAVGDVDTDGVLDVVVGQNAPGSMAVLLGDGAGGFTSSASIPSVPRSSIVALGDLDEDGPLDVVSLDVAARTLQWFRGNGSAGFAAPVVTALPGSFAGGLALGDLDDDGHLDAVVSGTVAGLPVVHVLRGDGDGGWLAPVPITTNVASDVKGLAVGDVDGDGRADVAAAQDAGVALLRGFTAGGFSSVTTQSTDSAAQSVALADVDLDAKLDLLAGHSGELGVSKGDGSGAFGVELLSPIGNGAITHSFGVADVSGDGWPDAVVGRQQQERVFVMLGDGTGAFQSVSVHVLGQQGVTVVLADLDGDGRTEMLTALRNLPLVGGGALLELPNIEAPFTWKDLGHGLAGAAGVPLLAGHGTLATASTVSLSLAGAAPLKPAYLVVGYSQLDAPFKGGVLVPFPNILLTLGTGASGGFAMSGTVQPGIPPGFTFRFQVWIVDSGGPAGFAATRGLSGTTPP